MSNMRDLFRRQALAVARLAIAASLANSGMAVAQSLSAHSPSIERGQPSRQNRSSQSSSGPARRADNDRGTRVQFITPERQVAQRVGEPATRLAQNANAGEQGGPLSASELQELKKAALEQLNIQKESAPSRNESPLLVDPAETGYMDGEAPVARPQPTQRGPGPSNFKINKLPSPKDERLSVHIQNKDLREVLDFLGEQGGLSILCSSTVEGLVSVSLNDVSIDTALSAILKSTGFIARREGKVIYVGNAQDIQKMAHSIDRIGTRVYRPNYVRASDLQPLILPLLTKAGSVGVASSDTGIAVSPPAQTGIAADGTNAGGDSFAQSEVVLVRDYEAVLAEIDQVVAEIDKRPLQVAIEAMLLSVDLKDSNSFGVDFLFLRDNEHLRIATGSPLADLGQLSLTSGGLKLGFLDSSLGAFLSALQTIGETNVIASPQLMCLNKHKAEILIGAQLGYVTKTLTQTTTTQTVEFLEVGTQLRLRPFISTDGLIRMEVHPELSTGTVEVKEGFTLPNKQVTQVTTNIMVRDGCTVVIGGLMQENLASTASPVPFFGSLPGMGFLFRNRTATQNRSEIIVLITPHIVYEPESCVEGDRAACDFHRHQAVYRDQMAPLNSRYLGRKFFRRAQQAWSNNDRQAAMRCINLAIHFDPQNRASIDLRSDIMAGQHYGPHSGAPMVSVEAPAEAINGDRIGPWVLDELEEAALVDPNPHPRDRGVNGRVLKITPGGNLR